MIGELVRELFGDLFGDLHEGIHWESWNHVGNLRGLFVGRILKECCQVFYFKTRIGGTGRKAFKYRLQSPPGAARHIRTQI